jgi:hypothetical protein
MVVNLSAFRDNFVAPVTAIAMWAPRA